MANTIINEAPQELPNPSLDIGYTRAVISYGPSSDEDITNLAVWLTATDVGGGEVSNVYYKSYDPNDLLFRLEGLEKDTAYEMVAAYQDSFVSSVPSLKSDRSSNLINLHGFDPYGVREPVSIVSVETRSSDLGQVGSPPNTIAIGTQGTATEAVIELLEVSDIPEGVYDSENDYPWELSKAIYKGSVDEGEILLITTPSTPFVLRVKSKYRMVDGVVDTSPAEYFGTIDTPVEEANETPPPLAPVDLNIQGVAVTGGVERYNARLSWDYEESTGEEGLFRNAIVSYRVVSSDEWVVETSLTNSHTFIGVPFRKQLEFKVKVLGWNQNESEELQGFAFFSNLSEDSSEPNYIELVDDTDIPTNTNVQIGSGGIRGYSNWDGTAGTLVFFLDASTGNLTLGDTLDSGVAPLTFNAETNRLSIKGETITDSIVSADYVMGWLDGETPTFRTANRTSEGGYEETTSGIWMGYEDSSTFKFSLGDSAQYIKWDGSTLKISGDVEIGDTGSTINQKSKYVQIYKRSSSEPSKPTTGSYDSPVPSGWSTSVPSYDGNPLYTTARTFTTDTLPPQDNEWSEVSELAPAIESAKLVQLVSDSQVFVVDNEGVSDKENVTITAYTKNVSNPAFQWTTVGGNGTVGPNGDTYTINISDFGLSSSIEVSVLVPNPMGPDLVDTITVVRVQDGLDGESTLSAYLTNEAHTVASDVNGDVADFTDASGYMIVYYGSTDITSLCTFSAISSSSGMDGGINSNGGYYTNDLTAEAGTLTLRATHPTLGSIDKVFSLSKSSKGDTGDKGDKGDKGDSAPLVRVMSDSQAFKLDKHGNPDRTSVTITAVTSNITTPSFSWNRSGGSGTSTSSGNTYTLTLAEMGSDNAVTVTVSVPDPLGGPDLEDTITIVKLEDGADGESNLVAYLTNEAHTLAADSDGTVSDYSGAVGVTKVFYGVTDVTSECTFSKVAETPGLSLTVFADGSYGVNALSYSQGGATIRATHPTYGSVDKVFSVSKSIKGDKGADGDSAPLIRLQADSQAFKIDKNGDSDRSSITLTATTENVSNPSFNWSRAGGAGTSSTSGNTYTLTLAQMGGDSSVTITVSVANPLGGDDLEDTITIVKLEDGVDGESSLYAYLTNESHVLAANSSGTVSDYSGAIGVTKVFYGTTDITSECTFTKTNETSGLSLTLFANGSYQVNSLSVEQGSATIMATHPVYGTVNKVFSVSKSVAGAAGADGADGQQGYRGPGRYSVAYGGTWPSVFNNTLAQVCAGATLSGEPVEDDVVTVYSSADPSKQFTVIYLGGGGGGQLASDWDEFELTVHGSLLVDDTIRGEKIVAGAEITAPRITGGYLKIGSTGTNQIVLDSENSDSPLTVTGPDGNLLLGWANNKFHFDGSLGSGKIDSMSVFTQEVRDIINPPVQGSLGGTFTGPDASGNSTSSISTQISPFIANTMDVVIGCSVSIIDANAPLNPDAPRWTSSIQRSINGGGWNTIYTAPHMALHRSEPGSSFSEIYYSATVSYTDSPNISEQDTLAYRIVFSRSSGHSGVSVSIRDMSVSQALTGGGLEGHATSASFPYIGLTNSGGSYPVMEIKNNPSSDDWVRTVSGRGILPYSSGNGSIGTSSYKFANVTAIQHVVNTVTLSENTGGSLKIQGASGSLTIGPQSTSTCNMDTDRSKFTFNKPIYVGSEQVVARSNLVTTVSSISSNWTYNGKVFINSGIVNSTYYKTSGYVGLVGNYSSDPRSKQIIWTLDENWTSMSNNHGLAYNYETGGGHIISVDDNGTTKAKFYLSGSAWFLGNVSAADVIARSDTRVKSNITPIANSSSKIKAIGGYDYYRTDTEELSSGVLAQEVQSVLPNAVTEVEGLLAVKPMAVIGLLVEGLKEEIKARESIESRLDNLEKILKNPPE